MDYKEALQYIENTAKFGMNLGLERIERLLELMGDPHERIRCIHVAGTNGKGSVTSMISSMLKASGYKVGMYTSPHLQRFTERIMINGFEITEEDVAGYIGYMQPIIERIVEEGYEHPTEFEIITAMMFKYFHEKEVDFAVIEVGLGGRLDATNVINPLVSVITAIGYDHMNVLGNTLKSIAYEKAGIIKENGIVVTYPQEDEAESVIKEVCERKHASLVQVDGYGLTLKDFSLAGQTFDMKIENEVYGGIDIKLLGEHQLINAKTAVAAIRALSNRGICIEKNYIYEGLKNTSWPGRLEVIQSNPVILLDGAHNPQGIESLRNALGKYFTYEKLVLVVGILKDKEADKMCSMLLPMADSIITVRPLSERAMSPDELKGIALKYCRDVTACDNIDDAVDYGMALVQTGGLLLFCGSLYMIGHIRALLEERGII